MTALNTKLRIFRASLAALLFVAAAAIPARANYGSRESTIPDVGVIPQPNAQVPLDATFTNETGETVALSAYFAANRPVILIPVYYECPSICNNTLNDLVRAIQDGPRGLTLGKDYQIVCISINPKETPKLAAAKRRNYLKSLGQPDLVGGWHFLVGDEAQIHRVTNTIGFYYRKDDVSGYDHAAAIFMLTAQGRVASTIGGPGFTEPNVSIYDQLMNASNGTIGSGMVNFARLCGLMKFDATTGRFVHNPWMWAATIGGGLIFLTVAIFVGSLWVGEYKKAKAAKVADTPPAPPATPAAGF